MFRSSLINLIKFLSRYIDSVVMLSLGIDFHFGRKLSKLVSEIIKLGGKAFVLERAAQHVLGLKIMYALNNKFSSRLIFNSRLLLNLRAKLNANLFFHFTLPVNYH